MAGDKMSNQNTGLGEKPLPTAGAEEANPSISSIPDLKKRRLVRGAVAAAPVLLTLRSGALAAVSCTPVKAPSVTINKQFNINGVIQSGYSSPDAGPTDPDVCYTTINQGSCTTGIETTGNTPLGVVKFDNANSVYYCEGAPTGGPHTVAILSWGAAQSISA